MGNIQLLDEFTINQIAAGEIIERPASIVKELVENSIDARSSAITIEINDGGIAFIRVTDNGEGIDEHNASLAFERHATSKISSASELDNIISLGFRGEALASIAAVTQMEMITRPRGGISGIHIVKHGSETLSKSEVGCPEGTTIITRNLFFNAPARLKFLKSSRTETTHINDIVSKLLLAHPEISFKYISNGKTIFHSPGNGNNLSAIITIYGKDIIHDILPIEIENNNIVISGFLGKPSLSRFNRNHQSFFVNGRYIKSNLLSKCIEYAYKPYLMVNRFPWAILYITMPSTDLDVNVHPAKTEIRFKNEQSIYDITFQGIKEIIDKPYIPHIIEESYNNNTDNTQHKVPNMDNNNTKSNKPLEEKIEKKFEIAEKNIQSKPEQVFITDFTKEPAIEYDRTITDTFFDNNMQSFDKYPLKVVGRVFSTYVIVESQSELFIIDQHAAHERLLYEKFKASALNRQVASQQLLTPLVLELTYNEKDLLSASIKLFSDLGFEIEDFGGNSFVIRAVPDILIGSNIKEFINELLDKANDADNNSDVIIGDDKIIMTACKKAVKAHDPLTDKEITSLIKLLKENSIPMTCPHGRPIMISMTKYELEKNFKRIQ